MFIVYTLIIYKFYSIFLIEITILDNNINKERNSHLPQMQPHLHSIQAQLSQLQSAEELQATTSDPQNPPQLWGTDGATYLTTVFFCLELF